MVEITNAQAKEGEIEGEEEGEECDGRLQSAE